jgi:mannosyltransferase OCH1-like enzyme
MIPKKIHYCWFGRGKLPPVANKCFASWRKFLAEYEIIKWDENSFDVYSNRYVREAYANGKFAFVSDYVRLHALYFHGGIYMDIDVEVLKSLDRLLVDEAFSGFESTKNVSCGIMASVLGQRFIGELLSEYNERSFLRVDGGLDTTTNVKAMTTSALRYGLKLDGTKQTVNGMTFYPPEFFYPYDDLTGVTKITQNSYCIHWFSKTWLGATLRLRSRVTKIFHRLFGINCFAWLKKIVGEV